MNKFIIRLMANLVLLLLGLASIASANVSVRFCFVAQTNYTDYADGDYWTSGYYREAYGIRTKVYDNSTGSAVYDGWANVSGEPCTTNLSLNTNRTYTVRLWSKAKDNNDNIVHVFQSYSGENLHQQTVDTSYSPTANATEVYTYTMHGDEHEMNVLMAASFALREHPAGLSGHNYHFYTHTLNNTGAHTANGVVYLDQGCKDAKTGTTHELGHVVQYLRNGSQTAFTNYDDKGYENCTSTNDRQHLINSREWQTAAATEGSAHFYAAITWNDKYNSDCSFRGDDCQGGEDYQVDWLDQCQGSLTNRGNELDWLRFWWDLYRDQDLSASTIYSIWDDANPSTWVASNVYKRLRDAAASNGVSNYVWDFWGSYNGVDHGVWP